MFLIIKNDKNMLTYVAIILYNDIFLTIIVLIILVNFKNIYINIIYSIIFLLKIKDILENQSCFALLLRISRTYVILSTRVGWLLENAAYNGSGSIAILLSLARSINASSRGRFNFAE